MIKSNPIPDWWATHKLENNYIPEVLPQEDSEPHIKFPSLGVWHWEEETPKHLALKVSGT